jgi:hypothetical protein
MKRKTKGEKFVELFKYWGGRLGLKENIPVIRDNRYSSHACIEIYDRSRTPVLKYNAKKLARWHDSYLVASVFHEIGHLIYNGPYRTEKQKIYDEYRAEKFALKMLKKYYPRLYHQNIKGTKQTMKDKKWFAKDTIHWHALKMIKEYRSSR